MKILVIGAHGTIGQAICDELRSRHEMIAAGRSKGDVRVDISNTQSIRDMYRFVGHVDAVACAAGNVHFGPLESMTEESFALGLRDKLMGQVQLVLEGRGVVAQDGSFSLITGILSREPIRFGASASLVNGALESFVRAAALELPGRQRINAISPTVLEESMGAYGDFFRGYKPVTAHEVALAFSKSIEGAQTGNIYVVE